MSAESTKQQPAINFGEHSIASVEEMRARARRHLESGAVTDDYKADRPRVIRVLMKSWPPS